MEERASTKAEADAQIEQVRRNKGVDGDNHQVSELLIDANAALAIISDNLYQEPSHFLFELLQNADDNRFAEGVIPTLDITLYLKAGKGYLRTDCNEQGFLLKDLHAICRIGQSTKRVAAGGTRDCIGEKGIGFKSVFRAANVVNVGSGYYEFKFDRTSTLGMVLPINSPFPRRERVRHHTQFLLHLKKKGDYETLNRDLCALEPQTLLFLRNIRSLGIETKSAKQRHQLQQIMFEPNLEGEAAVLLSGDKSGNISERRKYIIVRDKVHGLLSDDRRQGVTSSEVVLAFPITDSCAPIIALQKAFAFLPIGIFGFKFLIHADFLLVASREGLEYDNAWNLVLRDCIRQAFFKAVSRLANIPRGCNLRYMWPKYITHHHSSHGFWNVLHQEIISDLRQQQIFESCDPRAGNYLPSDLRYVEKKLRFNGAAIFGTSELRKKHLSFDYDGCISELKLLGVCDTSTDDLMLELSTWIAENGVVALASQPVEWHQQVASLFTNETRLKVELAALPIIPVRNGSWACAKSDNLYLASKTDDEYVPNGIDIQIVEQSASGDSLRRRFYKFLGIKTYTSHYVCSLILELHAGYNLRTLDRRAPEDLIKDAAYLFQHQSLGMSQGGSSLYFLVQNQGKYSCRKTEIYILDDVTNLGLIAKYKNTERNPFYTIDERYEALICPDEITRTAWRAWLLASGTVSANPRLIRNANLSAEWFFLRDTDVLDLLKVIKHDLHTGNLNSRLLTEVPQLLMACRDGLRRPLCQTAVPTGSLEAKCPHIAYADLPVPDEWTFLAEFGVPISPDTNATLRELDALAHLPLDMVDKDAVHRCYRRLNRSSVSEQRMIMEMFAAKSLVLIAKPQQMWVSHNSCVWNAPSALRRVTKLANRYSDCYTLCCTHLNVRSADIHDVELELCSLSSITTQEEMILRCQELLITLTRYLPAGSEFKTRTFLRLRNAKVFPVLEATTNRQVDAAPAYVFRAISDKDWYIPDRITLGIIFNGKHNLLGLSVQTVQILGPLFERLDACNKYLSASVREHVEPRGLKTRDTMSEQDLCRRMQFISALNIDNVSSSQSYRPLRVWRVPSVVIVRNLESVSIEEDNNLITLQEDADTINIYLRATISPSKLHAVKFELAKFFTKLYDVKSEDAHVLNQFLDAPLEDLQGILNENNRFLPDAEGADAEYAVDGHGDVMGSTSEEHALGEISANQRSNGQGVSTWNSALGKRLVAAELGAQIVGGGDRLFSSLGSDWPFLLKSLWNADSLAKKGHDLLISRTHAPRCISKPRTKNGRHKVAQQQMLLPDSLQSSSTPMVFDEAGLSSEDTTVTSSAQLLNNRELGSYGELFINSVLESHINDWSLDNWTSKLRVDHNRPPFTQPEKGFTDFTYVDTTGQMKAFLQDAGEDATDKWSRQTTYHLEVKTTMGDDYNEPFYISQNQLNMMRKYDHDANNAYILLRVFGIGGPNPDFKIYSCPWTLYMEGALSFVSRGGYQGQLAIVEEFQGAGPGQDECTIIH